jgi:hypothetical protein
MCIKHLGVRLKGVANKTPYLGRSWALPNDSKHTIYEAGFSTISTDSRVAQMPKSRDMCWRQTDKPIALPLLCMRACGVIINIYTSSTTCTCTSITQANIHSVLLRTFPLHHIVKGYYKLNKLNNKVITIGGSMGRSHLKIAHFGRSSLGHIFSLLGASCL